jgi:chemotaxis protein CheD
MMGSSTDSGYTYLKPGSWYFGPGAGIIRTILGSCVAVTMFHKRSGQSAICHAVMPLCEQNGSCSVYCAEHSRYTDCIVRAMSGLFFEQGVKAKEIEVKLFGGSNGLGAAGDPTRSGVGKQNVTQARKALQERDLILKVSDVGGTEGRKLLFDTSTGEVMIKKLTGSGVYRALELQ